MGKKKVAQKSQDEISKEGKKTENVAIKASGKEGSKKIDIGRIYVNASYNNTMISVTDDKGNVLAWASAGGLGFSGPKKATPFAASKIIATLAEKLQKTGPLNVHVLVNGVGGGRDSSLRSMANQGFNILSIRDVTPVPHNGPRSPKVRRV